jgi:hypothetical protein
MADALRVADQGVEAVRTVLPTTFNWTIFVVGLVLMTAPVVRTIWRGRRPVINALARSAH